jgi:putative glutamine amidotransferase
MKLKKKRELPIIGISASLLTIESGCFMGRERTFVGHDYIQAIAQAGGVPLVLPIIEDKKRLLCQVEIIDGLLLSGGYDVNPLQYGQEPEGHLEQVNQERDSYEMDLLRASYQLHKPILGICRGQQLLNVAFGGTLYQDIPSAFPSAVQHRQKSKPDAATHTIDLVEGTLLQQLMGSKSVATNSHHHQAVKNVAPGFVVNALAKDGIIEGIEKKDSLFVLGVQWHPEFMTIKDPKMLRLFQAFVEAARSFSEGP